MTEMERHKAIPILFNYIGEYESGGKFESNEFINYFENVLAHLKTVRDQNNLDIVKGVDDTLLAEFDRVPFTSPKGNTDVRYFTAHLLATAFPIIIPMAGQFQQAYRFCSKLRQNKADIDFLELELTAFLLDRGLLKKNPDLRFFFVTKISEIQNLNHDPNILEESSYQNVDRLESIPPSRLFLALRRRNIVSGSSRPAQLMQDKQSPEYRLSEFKVFSRMSESNPVYHDLLLQMGFMKTKIPFWGKFKQGLGAIFQFIMGVFRAPKYVWFALSKSRANTVFYMLTFVVIIILLFSFFKLMGAYSNKIMMDFRQNIEDARNL
ncbi:MAG TPA: hypothetical protein DCZ43_06450 [candidate division Zixibacteria bacterium]|nr:hypothetical protein [candidate division Zixibacteria bacterium]